MNFVVNLLMIFSPVIGYVDQYKKIKETKNSESFSKLVSLILFLSNVLRIFFWYGKRFDIVMLYQSLVMIICQFFMIKISTDFQPVSFGKNSNSIFDLNNFWNWKNFIIYGKLSLKSLFSGILCGSCCWFVSVELFFYSFPCFC
jgi:solute carrier family 66, member 2